MARNIPAATQICLEINQISINHEYLIELVDKEGSDEALKFVSINTSLKLES